MRLGPFVDSTTASAVADLWNLDDAWLCSETSSRAISPPFHLFLDTLPVVPKHPSYIIAKERYAALVVYSHRFGSEGTPRPSRVYVYTETERLALDSVTGLRMVQTGIALSVSERVYGCPEDCSPEHHQDAIRSYAESSGIAFQALIAHLQVYPDDMEARITRRGRLSMDPLDLQTTDTIGFDYVTDSGTEVQVSGAITAQHRFGNERLKPLHGNTLVWRTATSSVRTKALDRLGESVVLACLIQTK